MHTDVVVGAVDDMLCTVCDRDNQIAELNWWTPHSLTSVC